MLCVNPFNLYNTKKKKLSADELMIYTEIRPNPRFFGEGRDRIAIERQMLDRHELASQAVASRQS
jgi:hypothetical protein